MARTVNIALTITGTDTTNVTTNSNISNFVELIFPSKDSALLDSFNIEIPAKTAATSIKSQAAVLAGVTNVQFYLFITYNAAEPTKKVEVVIDSAATVANDCAAGIYTSTITLATTSLVNPCTVQAFFYEAY